MRQVDIRISVTYDETKFQEDDMRWASDKVAECGPIWDIGYDSESFDIDWDVTHLEVTAS